MDKQQINKINQQTDRQKINNNKQKITTNEF